MSFTILPFRGAFTDSTNRPPRLSKDRLDPKTGKAVPTCVISLASVNADSSISPSSDNSSFIPFPSTIPCLPLSQSHSPQTHALLRATRPRCQSQSKHPRSPSPPNSPRKRLRSQLRRTDSSRHIDSASDLRRQRRLDISDTKTMKMVLGACWCTPHRACQPTELQSQDVILAQHLRAALVERGSIGVSPADDPNDMDTDLDDLPHPQPHAIAALILRHRTSRTRSRPAPSEGSPKTSHKVFKGSQLRFECVGT
ncbi:hypothetical protein BD779DRAFT_1524715 [Infundibulicybe gibba]|nr:hypothetical protein BD779DRAFT_1524715 [Infundibulicybe gibba]